jgi:hypothetical protein
MSGDNTQFFFDNTAKALAIGTTTAYAKLSVQGASGSIQNLFDIASSTNASGSATTSLFRVAYDGRVSVASSTPSPLFGFTVGTTTLLTGTTTATNGINISSGCFAIAGTCLTTGGSGASTTLLADNNIFSGQNIFNNILRSTTTAATATNIFASNMITALGQIIMGTSSALAELAVQGTYGSMMPLFDIASSTNASGSATSSLFRIMANGTVGIGSSTPWAQLSIMGTSANNVTPLLAISTSTGINNFPLFYVAATTTGALDYSRVAIGTTTAWGNSGLRDQFTVAGRIYSTWNYLACDVGGSNVVGVTVGTFLATIAGQVQGCGEFLIDSNSTRSGYTMSNAYPTSLSLQADRTGQTPTNNDVVSLRTNSLFAAASSSPTLEARFKAPNQASSNGGASTTMYLIGFSDRTANGTNGGTLPTNMIGFVATNTPNWKAVISKAGALTITDTGISTTTTATGFSRFRVEVSSSTSNFLVNGTVVASISPTGAGTPIVPMAPMISVGKTVAAAVNVSQIDVNYLRVWVDDPITPGTETGLIAGLSEVIVPTKDESYGKGAGTGVWYYSSTTEPTEGDIVGFSVGTSSGVVESASLQRAPVGVVSSYGNIAGNSTGNIPVVTTGRVEVKVSTAGGAIAVGDAIAISSTTPGIGVRAQRAGYIVGHAVAAFDPVNGLGYCGTGSATSTEVTTTCVGMVAVQVGPGWSEGNTTLFSDVTETVTDVAQAVTDLASDVFTKGAEFTKLAIGKVVAQTAVVKDFFAVVFNILPGGSINVPSGTNQIAGSDTLPLGATTYFVANSGVTAGAKIFITPRTQLATPIAVTQVTPGEGFTVTLSGQAATDIPFDWFILSTYDAGGSQAAAIGNSNQSQGGGATPPAPAPAPTPTPEPPPSDGGTGSSTPDTGSSTPPVIPDTSGSSTDSGTGTSTTP